MRAKTPKISLALRGVASRRDAAKKVDIPRQKVRSRDFRYFFAKKTGWEVFYVGPRRISGRSVCVWAAVGEIMLAKVLWALEEVS